MQPSLFKPISKPELLVELVVEQVTTAVISGELHPGDKLVEERLAEQLNVSRVPVREAMHQLEQLGLVTRIPYRGTFVSELEDKDIFELHEVRLPLERLAARLITEKQNPDAIQALREIVAEMEKAAVDQDRRQMIELDARFHDTLIRMADNKLLAIVWEPVSIKMRRFFMLKRHHAHKSIDAVVPPHKQIVAMIEAGRPEEAEAAVTAHLTYVQQRYQDAIKKGESLT